MMGLLGLLITITLGMSVIQNTMASNQSSYTTETITGYDAETDETPFSPEDYSSYVSLEDQIQILKSLDFDISAENITEYKQWRDDYGDDYRVWLEGYPYYQILGDLSTPEWDENYTHIINYSDQGYWFDFEGWDISTDYIDILNGVNAIGKGSFSITDATEDISQVNWEKGTGYILVNYKLDGEDHQFKATMNNDWIDDGFITHLQDVLYATGLGKDLYVMDDDGQGCFLFFRDKNWAREFVLKTGLDITANRDIMLR